MKIGYNIKTLGLVTCVVILAIMLFGLSEILGYMPLEKPLTPAEIHGYLVLLLSYVFYLLIRENFDKEEPNN